VRVNAEPSFFTRLAVVLADPIRLEIVTELHMREMSSTEFHEAFGGDSLTKVNRHFIKLAEHGWLRLVRKESGRGNRRGAPEHFYRATELAVFDPETWAKLPYSIRSAFSRRIFEQFAQRAHEALEAGTFDSRPERYLTWTPVVLDKRGWDQLIAAEDALYESLAQEQADAKLRIAKSAAEPMMATIALAGFESPMKGRRPSDGEWLAGADLMPSANPAMRLDSPMPLTLRLAKVFADPLNLTILTELNIREMSATQFKHQTGVDMKVPALSHRFKMLAELGWLVEVDKRTGGRRRGATEHFFRATGPATFSTHLSMSIPSSARSGLSWTTLDQLFDKATEAMEAGTLDARVDRHLSCSLLLLDELGWQQVIAALDSYFEGLFEAQAAAKARLARSEEKPMLATFVVTGFESPMGRRLS
jgi:DNA-binding transcriptional ArsR family regulator